MNVIVYDYRLKVFRKKSSRSEMILFLRFKRGLKRYQVVPQETNNLEDGRPPPHLTISNLICQVLRTLDGNFESEYLEQSEESSQFRNEYEMRKMKRACEFLYHFYAMEISSKLIIDYITEHKLLKINRMTLYE